MLREWWANPRIPISPANRLRLNWIIIVITAVGWPLSALTFAAGEPQGVLALSWLALSIGALGNLLVSDVSAEQKVEEEKMSQD